MRITCSIRHVGIPSWDLSFNWWFSTASMGIDADCPQRFERCFITNDIPYDATRISTGSGQDREAVEGLMEVSRAKQPRPQGCQGIETLLHCSRRRRLHDDTLRSRAALCGHWGSLSSER